MNSGKFFVELIAGWVLITIIDITIEPGISGYT